MAVVAALSQGGSYAGGSYAGGSYAGQGLVFYYREPVSETKPSGFLFVMKNHLVFY